KPTPTRTSSTTPRSRPPSRTAGPRPPPKSSAGTLWRFRDRRRTDMNSPRKPSVLFVVVCRRYWSINLKEVRKLGTAQGGAYADGTRFQFAGGQIRSLLSLISYFGQG